MHYRTQTNKHSALTVPLLFGLIILITSCQYSSSFRAPELFSTKIIPSKFIHDKSSLGVPKLKKLLRDSSLIPLYAFQMDAEFSRKIIDKVDLILMAPLDSISLDEVSKLRKLLGSGVKSELLNSSDIIELVDGTPHVQVASYLSSSIYLVIAVQGDTQKSYDTFTRWIKSMTAPITCTFLISKKGHLLQIQS